MTRLTPEQYIQLFRGAWYARQNDPLSNELATLGLCKQAATHKDGGADWHTTGAGFAALKTFTRALNAYLVDDTPPHREPGFYMGREDALKAAKNTFEFRLADIRPPHDEDGRPDLSALTDEERSDYLERERSIAFEALRLMVTPPLDPAKVAGLSGTASDMLESLLKDFQTEGADNA